MRIYKTYIFQLKRITWVVWARPCSPYMAGLGFGPLLSAELWMFSHKTEQWQTTPHSSIPLTAPRVDVSGTGPRRCFRARLFRLVITYVTSETYTNIYTAGGVSFYPVSHTSTLLLRVKTKHQECNYWLPPKLFLKRRAPAAVHIINFLNSTKTFP